MDETKKRAKAIPVDAMKLKKLFLVIGLKKAHADGRASIAEEDYQLYSKLKGKKNAAKAQEAKQALTLYNIYSKNLVSVIDRLECDLNYALRGYNKTQKDIWRKYFLESKTIAEISDEVGLSYERVAHIVLDMRKDLNKEGEGE